MLCHMTEGVKNCTGYQRVSSCPLFLTDNLRVLEGPSLWALDVAKRGSVSKETLKQYTSILARFLKWLDSDDVGAENWLMVADESIDSYINHLIETRDELGRPDDASIEFYVARIADLYRWALGEGYPIKWDMDLKKVTYKLRDLSLRGTLIVTRSGLERRLSRGAHPGIVAQKHRFLTDSQLLGIYPLFHDKVYSVIAFIIRNVGLRPKDLFQLPYRGKGLNAGLRDYRPEEDMPSNITYEFESKGKRRAIDIPGKLWKYVCEEWMPERIARVRRLEEQGKELPSISHLFIDVDGNPLTYHKLWKAFSDILEHPARPEGLLRCCPKMLRHAFATYYVYNALKQKGTLGKPYQYDIQIDEQLRLYMGHRRSETTYKFYVHLAGFLSAEDVMGPIVDHVLNVVLPEDP